MEEADAAREVSHGLVKEALLNKKDTSIVMGRLEILLFGFVLDDVSERSKPDLGIATVFSRPGIGQSVEQELTARSVQDFGDGDDKALSVESKAIVINCNRVALRKPPLGSGS